VHLRSVIRQADDQHQLKQTLASMREYKTTQEQARWLQTFQWDNLKKSHGEELLIRMSNNSLCVFPNHQDEWNHNKVNILEVNKQFPIAKLTAISEGTHAKGLTSDKAGGLVHTLYLCKGARVMLSVNINVRLGLFNGAMGRIIDIVFLNDKGPNDSLPDVVMVEFDKYSGPPFMQDNPKLVPIVPVERRLDCNCCSCKRKQIPLRLGWGTTIHRCQGMTIGAGEPNRYIVINPGSRCFESRNPGALFVALSRAKTAGGDGEDPDFAWHPSVLVNEDRLCHVVNTPTTKARSKEITRIANLAEQTKVRFHGILDEMSDYWKEVSRSEE
jgi:hypothetical protein